MKILVVDVAAETGGAKTILEQFLNQWKADTNHYTVLLSKLSYNNSPNITFRYFPWTKKSYFHRLWFDYIWVRHIIKKEKPDCIISLQNNAVWSGKVFQKVYFHNSLFISDYNYSYSESRILWFYQNILSILIRHSLKKANKVVVQSNWMKQALVQKWNIEENRIDINAPEICFDETYVRKDNKKQLCLFYPANYQPYKNHITLLKACEQIWNERGPECGLRLYLTGSNESIPDSIREKIKIDDYPIFFIGYLDSDGMAEMYSKTSLVFPSLIESVGLPLLEAQKFNSWILCSDLVYAHESTSEYSKTIYFDPISISSIKSSIEHLNTINNCF